MLPKVPQTREDVTLPWIQEALKQSPFEIINMSWNGSVGNGIGALSSMDRLSLTVFQQGTGLRKISLVLKTPPTTNIDLRNFVISEGFCQREFQMYTKIFPSWRKFQQSRGTPSKYHFRHPHCYYAAEEGSGPNYKMILLLEDMNASGYSTWAHGYHKGLRWAQAKQVVQEMAIFHAVGMAYKNAQGIKHYVGPEYDWLYTHSKDENLLDTFLRSGINSTCNMLRSTTTTSIPSGLIFDLESFSDVHRLQQLSFPRGDRAGTITHQDLHTHNIMLSNNGDGVALLDFQGCSYASPMSDLTFFLLLCCDPSLFTTHLGLVLRCYADTFGDAMHAMDTEEVAYLLQEVVEDYHAALFVSVIHIVLGSPSWCFSTTLTSSETQERFKTALIDSYQRCGGHFGLDTLEQFSNYFTQTHDDEDEDDEDEGDDEDDEYSSKNYCSIIIAEE